MTARLSDSPGGGPPLAPREYRRTGIVVLAYLVVAVAFTWPLAAGLNRDVPYDLGDSVLNMWILSWNAEQLRRLLFGEWSVLFRWFDGNIFYPVPDTLAYSEHLIAQSIQIFPVYLATRNPLLCYNLLFLSTYVLSGLGTYLLVRELTGDRRAAFVAGLIFAFIPYRVAQASHLQVLSSQWMPFTLWGITRYLNTGRRSALAGGAAALLTQALSCGYYLIYFTPFAVGYLLWELARRGRLGDTRVWIDGTVAAIVSGAAALPFLLPYTRAHGGRSLSRSLGEVSTFSADVYAYVTAFPLQRFWGSLLYTLPRGEGELFMGAVPLLLAVVGGAAVLRRSWRDGARVPDPHPVASRILGTVCAAITVLTVAAIYADGFTLQWGGVRLRMTDVGRLMLWTVIAGGLLMLVSPRLRARLRALRSVEVFFFTAIVATWWLSLGPLPTSFGARLQIPAPYGLFYALPGVDGLRVPARLAMVMALMLAVVGGFTIARLPKTRVATLVTALVVALFIVEAPASPFPVNSVGVSPGFGAPEGRLYPPAAAPPLYHAVANLGDDVVLLELPIGDSTWDVIAMYYSTTHWRPIVNGYSGFFPPHYYPLVAALRHPTADSEKARQWLADSGATHVLMHERGFSTTDAAAVRRWLTDIGANAIASAGRDTLYAVRR